MKYWFTRNKKTLLMQGVSITKREIWQLLADFRIKKNDILSLFECLSLFREFCFLAKKQMWSDCSFICSLEEQTSLSLQIQRHGPIIWAKPKWTLFDIYAPFYLSASPSQTRVMNLYFYNHHIYRDMQMR